MNKVILKGRLARDIELRTTTTGKSVGTFSLAVDRRFKQEGQPDADFIPCVAWGKTAEVMAQYLAKGRETLVEGRMQVRSYDDKEGNKRYVTEVIVENFEFCGSKADAGFGGGAPAPAAAPAANSGFGGGFDNSGFGQPVAKDDDIPF